MSEVTASFFPHALSLWLTTKLTSSFAAHLKADLSVVDDGVVVLWLSTLVHFVGCRRCWSVCSRQEIPALL